VCSFVCSVCLLQLEKTRAQKFCFSGLRRNWCITNLEKPAFSLKSTNGKIKFFWQRA
jgi:hypothetical protein